jgi:hypothetical protein
MSRREKIEAMLVDEPDDVFLRYSLAMELDKEGEHERSLAEFERLTTSKPPYVPAFFMSAQQMARLDRNADAADMLRTGIAAAQIAGDAHAAAEMGEFLASLQM